MREDMESILLYTLKKFLFFLRYQLKLNYLQVIVCKCTDNWSMITKQKKSNFHIVNNFSLSLDMER